MSSLPPEEARRAGRASALGIELAATIIGFLLIGWWLDGFFGYEPWFTIAGILMGSFAGFMVVWRFLRRNPPDGE